MSEMPEGLREAIAHHMGRPQAVEPDAGTQIGALRSIADRYSQNPFKTGDIITARAGHNIVATGRPALVVEVVPHNEARPRFEAQMLGTPHDGAMYDMRIIVWMNGDYEPYWVESWQFETYVGQPDQRVQQ